MPRQTPPSRSWRWDAYVCMWEEYHQFSGADLMESGAGGRTLQSLDPHTPIPRREEMKGHLQRQRQRQDQAQVPFLGWCREGHKHG